MSTEKLELFAVVELFGHQKMAGKVTEQSIGPATFVRVDVPETEKSPAFTRLLNPSAIYAINPVDEQTMKYKAVQLATQPIEAWDINKMHEKILQLGPGQKNNHEDPDSLPY